MQKQTKRADWDSYWAKGWFDHFTKASWSKRRIIEILNRYVNPGNFVLDAGSGSGFFSHYFLSKGCRVYSLDYSTDALRLTKKITEGKCKKYLKLDLRDSGLQRKIGIKFDCIFSDGLLEHFSEKDQNKIINNFSRIKKKNGLIITFVPNKYSIWEVIRPFFMPGIKEKPFTRESLRSVFKKFDIREQGGVNVFPLKYSFESAADKFGMFLYCVCS
jgi:SAM-dependent methyltransferase